jgi:diaminopimelate decarboxylase
LTKKQFGEYISINEKGHLQVEDCDTIHLAKRFGTPLYVISESTIRSNCQKFIRAFKSRYQKTVFLFEHKVNEDLAISKILQQEGFGAGVAGLGELYAALLTGVDPKKIIFNATSKPREQLKIAVENNIFINVSSFMELEIVNEIAKQLDNVQKIFIGLKVPLYQFKDKGDNRRQKRFGFNTETGEALKACRKAITMKNIELAGLHIHIGFLTTNELVRNIVSEVMDFVGELKKNISCEEPLFINLGGGFIQKREYEYGPFTTLKDVPTIEEYADTIISEVNKKIKEYNLKEPTLMFEPGRYLVANAGILLSSLLYIKEEEKYKKWIIIDASINQLDRVLYYKYLYKIIVANKANLAYEEKVDVTGPLFIGQDVIRKDIYLQKTSPGDLIAILDTGAYAESNESQYTFHPRTQTVLVCQDKAEIIKKKETISDLISRDKIPLRLLKTK